MRQSRAKPLTGPLRLFDRADGVKGHYCIGREVKSIAGNYYEFWNPKSKSRWSSAGKVIEGKAAAEQKMRELQHADRRSKAAR